MASDAPKTTHRYVGLRHKHDRELALGNAIVLALFLIAFGLLGWCIAS